MNKIITNSIKTLSMCLLAATAFIGTLVQTMMTLQPTTVGTLKATLPSALSPNATNCCVTL